MAWWPDRATARSHADAITSCPASRWNGCLCRQHGHRIPAGPAPNNAAAKPVIVLLHLLAGQLTTGVHQGFQVACRRGAAHGSKRTQRAGQASLVGGACDVHWRHAVASRGAAAVVGAGAGVAVAASVAGVTQQHICITQAATSRQQHIRNVFARPHNTHGTRADQRLGRQCGAAAKVIQCVWRSGGSVHRHSLHAEALLPPGRDTLVSSQATGAASWLRPGHLRRKGSGKAAIVEMCLLQLAHGQYMDSEPAAHAKPSPVVPRAQGIVVCQRVEPRDRHCAGDTAADAVTMRGTRLMRLQATALHATEQAAIFAVGLGMCGPFCPMPCYACSPQSIFLEEPLAAVVSLPQGAGAAAWSPPAQ